MGKNWNFLQKLTKREKSGFSVPHWCHYKNPRTDIKGRFNCSKRKKNLEGKLSPENLFKNKRHRGIFAILYLSVDVGFN